jgi:hypothetical protein
VKEQEYRFPGFADMKLERGKYWTYQWTYDTSSDPEKTGRVTYSLDTAAVAYRPSFGNGIGELELFSLTVSKSGDRDEIGFPEWHYMAMKEGVLYGVSWDKDFEEIYATTLFNTQAGANTGNVFMGYLSSERPETVSTEAITFSSGGYSGRTGVLIKEQIHKSFCEVIAGVRICDDESYDYEMKEFYLPGIGFAAFYRYGTSSFSGGGFGSTHTSLMNVWLVETNMGK